MTRRGRDFERAVWAFARTLDPSVEVLFDHRIRDTDTGKFRQCDAWITTTFGKHWPVSILVSCKDRRKSGKKLDSGDIGTFRDEVRSTRANVGVIYSNTGFTKPALEKAEANAITCCRLYQREPADTPDVLCFEQFACSQRIQLGLQTHHRESRLKKWNDVFVMEAKDRDGDAIVLDLLCDAFKRGEEKAVAQARETGSFPPDWETEISIKVHELSEDVRLRLLCKWSRYRARVEAHLIDGSWCLSSGSFRGKISVPPISMKDTHPGEGWTEISDADLALPARSALAIRYAPDVKRTLREEIGPTALV